MKNNHKKMAWAEWERAQKRYLRDLEMNKPLVKCKCGKVLTQEYARKQGECVECWLNRLRRGMTMEKVRRNRTVREAQQRRREMLADDEEFDGQHEQHSEPCKVKLFRRNNG